MKTFYRVNHYRTGQGLWYDFYGAFTGLIHDRFNFCENRHLPMEFDSSIVGWLSVTPTLEELERWFPSADQKELAKHGWYVHEYEVPDEYSRFYEPNSHWLIKQGEEKLVRIQNFGYPLQ